MKVLNFRNIEEFCDFISEDSNSCDTGIIAKYDEMCKIIEELIKRHYNIYGISKFYPADFEGYKDEYTLMISYGELGLFESKDTDGKYHNNDFTELYILENCNSKIASTVVYGEAFEVDIDECDG